MSEELNDLMGPEPDSEQLGETTRSLSAARPVPSPTFRGELGRLLGLVALVRPVARWRMKALALAVVGALLLGTAGVGVAGSGPLAPKKQSQRPSNGRSSQLDLDRHDATGSAARKATVSRPVTLQLAATRGERPR